MHNAHMKKAPRLLIFRAVVSLVLMVVVCFSAVLSVTANTVSVSVVDGDKSYTFNMVSNDLDDILSGACDRGLAPVGELDVVEWVDTTTTVVIRRGVTVEVNEAGKISSFVAFRGDTVSKALSDNGILLKKSDRTVPDEDSVISGDLKIEILRSCLVSVYADGNKHVLSLVGKTVGDALKEAGVQVSAADTVNFDLREPLYDKMHIRVSRPADITVTADGETKEHTLSASSVEEALSKAGYTLGEYDQVSCDLTAPIADGMELIIRRGTVEEITVKETIPYETVVEETSSLYIDQRETKTKGEAGEKETVYKVLSLDGEEESREVVSETVIKEAVNAHVLVGTALRPALQSQSGAGTFVDMYGNTVSYSKLLVGECTAYSSPGGTTSLGWKAEYGVIAVDPDVIPYGTRMYICSPDGSIVYGYGVAGDTGGACMSGRIIADLCYNTVEECNIMGRRDMCIYILS